MATEQERFQILVELLGIDRLEAQAQAGVRAFNQLNEAVRGTAVGAGGQPQALRLAETAASFQLKQAQLQARNAEQQLQAFLKRPEGQQAQRILDYPIRTTRAGAPNQNDERAAAAQYRKNREIVDQLVEYRTAVLKTAQAEAAAQGKITAVQEKRQRAEYEAAGYAADEAALVKFRAERARGLTRAMAQIEQERLAAEKATAQAAKSLAAQTRAGQARQVAERDRIIGADAARAARQMAADEERIRKERVAARRADATVAFNQLPLEQLQAYKQPLLEGIHEPARTAVALARAQSEEADVRRRITEIIRRNQAGQLSANDTLAQLSAAQRQLTAVVQRRQSAEEKLAAESGGFGAQFARGFRGASDRPYAEQLGQAVKFSAFYGAAYRIQFALLQTFRDALVEGIAFEQGLSDLSLATGQTKDELTGVANQLAKTASDAGVSPAAGLAIGARAIGLYGLAGSPDKAQQDYVANLSAQVVSKLTLGGKADPVVVQQNLAAITQALGIGAAGQLRVADLDAYFSKRFGTGPGETLEAGAQSASVGIAAGFTLEEIQAAAALMISRTGQSSGAVGGYLAQIFSRGGEGSLTNVAQKYGIETQGRQLADVFNELAQMYQQSGSAAQAEIAAAFGRGKVQNAVVTLLQSFQEVQDEAKKAREGAADGALDRSFTQRINNIGGQIAILGGHFKEFARLFGQSGMLAILGLAVEVLDQLVTSVNAVLRVFNELPEAVRVIIGLAAGAALLQKVGIGGAIFGGVAERFAAARVGGEAATGVRGVAGLGLAAARAIGPFAALTTAVWGAGKTLESIANIREQVKAGSQALLQAPGYNATPVELSTYASLLRDQARNLRQSDNGVWGNIGDFFTAGDPDKQARLLQEQAKRADAQAKLLEQVTKPTEPGIISELSKEGIAAGLDRISATGGDAASRLRQLRLAIEGVGESAEAANTKIDPKKLEFALLSVGKDLPEKIKFQLTGITDTPDFKRALEAGAPSAKYYDALRSVDTSKLLPDLQQALPADKLSEILTASLKAQGITDFTSLTPEAADKAADKAVAEIETGGAITTTNLSAVREAYAKVISKALVNQGKNIVDVINGAESLTNEQATIAMEGLAQETSGRLGQLSTVDYSGRMRVLRNALRTARHAQSVASDSDLPAIVNTIASFRQQYVATQIERLEALRHAAVANASSQAQATSIGRSFVRRQIRAIIRGGGNADQLRDVLSTAGKGAIAVARKAIEDALVVARAAAAVEAQLGAALAAIPDIWGTIPDADGKKGPAAKEVKRLEKLLDALQYVTPSANPDQIPGGSEADTETAAERRAARLAAAAARKGGDIAAARAAIAQAQADLQNAKKGTVEYYNALASLYQARDQLNEALRNYRHILGELRIDQTDPVAEAQLALTEARRKLRFDRRHGKARDVTAQDRLDVENAKIQLEAEKFNQRLSDVQTAEELGRISHAAYMRYLQSEHNRLSAISKRTRQQQDQLNQIDKLMKDAAGEMQGAFNIGDIKLPTPYEVRRYIKTQVSATPYALAPSATAGTTTIYINGADVGAVRRIINDTVGKGTRVLTTTTRRT